MHIASSNASDRAGPAARPADFTAATLRIAGRSEVLSGATYLTHGLGISGPNVGRLVSSVAFMSRITFPCCLLGGWHGEPRELRDAGFLEQLGGALIWTPSDTRSTCGLPPFRLLDYAVISPSFQVLARSMTALHDLPWHAHLGLEIIFFIGGEEFSVPRAGTAATFRPTDDREQEAALLHCARCQLVVVGLETGGWWSSEAVDFVSQLAGHRARDAPQVLRGSAFFAWLRRWQRMLSVSCARAFALFVGALTF